MAKIYNSDRLKGCYRCGKREGLMAKIPTLPKDEGIAPDCVDAIVSGIQNFGCKPDEVRGYAAMMLNVSPEEVAIPQERAFQARRQFCLDVIQWKLQDSTKDSAGSLIRTFFSFIQAPTETTKQLLMDEDIKTVSRYLNEENRAPANAEIPDITLCGERFKSMHTFVFAGYKEFPNGSHREGKKVVKDTIVRPYAEIVKLIPGKPNVTQAGKAIDQSVGSDLGLYVMLEALYTWLYNEGKMQDGMVIQSNYYFLKKSTETDSFEDGFFSGKGGNIVGISVMADALGDIRESYTTQLEAFLSGESVYASACEKCGMSGLCGYSENEKALDEEEARPVVELPKLSPDQEKAANALEGNIRVVATAGSGKTTVMAYRIMNLLKSGVEPEKIGCFTFTNAGAGEMRGRIGAYCRVAGLDVDIDKMAISTIHAFGDSLIKKNFRLLGYRKPPVLINEVQRTKIVEGIIAGYPTIGELSKMYKNFYMSSFNAQGILAFMAGCFSDFKKTGMTKGELEGAMGLYGIKDIGTMEAIFQMWQEFEALKKKQCLIEHDDQELLVLELLKVKPGLFGEVGIEHISLDEAQDTSNIQFEIIKAMREAPCTKSLFIVGDDDQSIYRFRDADVNIIIDFFGRIGEENGQDIQLMENRRSTGAIVGFADNIIANNANRVDKRPSSTNEAGEPVTVKAYSDKAQETGAICEGVKKAIEDGRKPSDIAVLMPTNAELAEIKGLLEADGIKTVNINPEPMLENVRVQAAVGLAKFILNGKELQAAAYLNALENGALMERPQEEIAGCVEKLKGHADGIATAGELLNEFERLDPDAEDEIFQAFLNDIKTAKEDAVKADSLNEVLSYIMDVDRFGAKLTARKEKSYEGVVLSTMHSSKGKEWPVVFLSMSKLHTKGMDQDDFDEKNRLLFVACTRAKKELHVSSTYHAYGSKKNGYTVNRYLVEALRANGEDIEEEPRVA